MLRVGRLSLFKSIKTKVFLIICAIAVAFISILTLLNLFGYNFYYEASRKASLTDIYDSINELYQGDSEQIAESLEQIENHTGVRLSVISGDTGSILYDSIFREQHSVGEWIGGNTRSDLFNSMLASEILSIADVTEIKKRGYTFVTTDITPADRPPIALRINKQAQSTANTSETVTATFDISSASDTISSKSVSATPVQGSIEIVPSSENTLYIIFPDGSTASISTMGVLPTGMALLEEPRTPDTNFFDKKNRYMCLVGTLNQQDMLIARVPLAYMEQNSSFNSTFLLISSAATFFICILLAYLLSNQFSRPLIEIEEVATAMADMDFSKQYTGKSCDEIGRLGMSINRLSRHLEQAICALKSTNKELAYEIKEKERIDSMRREFIINVSHELKTPLAVIQGYAEGLRVGIMNNEEDRNYYCDTIMDESQRMNRLVMQLLNLSKLEMGRESPEMTEIELYPMICEIVEKTDVLRAEHGLSIDISGVVDTVYADSDMLEQVASNYLSNAFRYTPDCGHITVFSKRSASNEITLYVKNDGESLPESELTMIFEQFYRTDKARTRESGGTGIGLSIVRAIADLHHGSCGATNMDNGICFWFQLPAASK